jgi:hypothetical protein
VTHPDAETIAAYQAGALARWRLFRRRRVAAHLAGCRVCAATARRLTTVTAVLAAAHHPTMPANVAERLTEVLAAQPTPDSRLTTHGRSTRLLAPSGGRRPRLVPVGVVVVILGVLGVGGYFLGQTQPSAGVSSSSATRSATRSGTDQSGGGVRMNPEHVGAQESTPGGQQSGYRVVASGTDYLPATLPAQVGQEMNDAALGKVAAPSALAGCVANVAAGSLVRFVDVAKYRGKRAWVIAASGRAWVTGTSCSATETDLLVTVALAAS